jgi:hypothetical protein
MGFTMYFTPIAFFVNAAMTTYTCGGEAPHKHAVEELNGVAYIDDVT